MRKLRPIYTSRNLWEHKPNRNKRFKEESEKRELSIDCDAKIGYSTTQPALGLMTFCTAQQWRNKLTIVCYIEQSYIPSITSKALLEKPFRKSSKKNKEKEMAMRIQRNQY